MVKSIEEGISSPRQRAYKGRTIEELESLEVNVLSPICNEPQLISLLLLYQRPQTWNNIYEIIGKKLNNYKEGHHDTIRKYLRLFPAFFGSLENKNLVDKKGDTYALRDMHRDDMAVKALALLSLRIPLQRFFMQSPQSRLTLLHHILTARENGEVAAADITAKITHDDSYTPQLLKNLSETNIITYEKVQRVTAGDTQRELGYVSLSPEQEENMRLLVSAASETFSNITEDSLKAIGEDLGISIEIYKDKHDLLYQLVDKLVAHKTRFGEYYNQYRENATKASNPIKIDAIVLSAIAGSLEPVAALSWRDNTGNIKDPSKQSERLISRGLIIRNRRRGFETKFALHPEVKEEIDKLRTAITNVLLSSDQEPNANELIKLIPLIAGKYNALAEPFIEAMTRDLRQKLEEEIQQRLRKERKDAFMSLKEARQNVLQQVVDNDGDIFIRALKPQLNTINEFFSGEKSNKLALAQALLIALNLDLSTQTRNKQAVFSDSREKLWGEIVNFARHVAEGSIDMQLRNLGKTIKDKSYVLGNERYNYIFMENDLLIPVQPEVRDVLSTIVVSKAVSAMQLLRVLPQEDLAGVVIALLSGDLAFALKD